MADHYLWYRAWPFYEPSFPFERFDSLDGNALSAALIEFASDWQRRNQRQAPKSKSAGSASPTNVRDFSEIAPIAGWVKWPSGPWGGPSAHAPFGFFDPRVRWYFHACERADDANTIVEVLRRRGGRRKISGGFEVVRFGVLDASALDKTSRISLALAVESYVKRSREPGWERWVLGELAKILPHVEAQPSTPVHEQPPAPDQMDKAQADLDEQKIRDRIGNDQRATFVIQVMQKVKQLDGSTLTVTSAFSCGLPRTTIHSYATSWSSTEKRGSGTRELWLSKDKVLRYIVSKWNPRSTGPL